MRVLSRRGHPAEWGRWSWQWGVQEMVAWQGASVEWARCRAGSTWWCGLSCDTWTLSAALPPTMPQACHMGTGKVTHSQLVLRPFSGTTQVSRCQKKSSPGLYGAREDYRGRHTEHPNGRHSIWTNQRPTSIIPTVFTPDALPAATLTLYPGLGQAPNMLACIPSGVWKTYVISHPGKLSLLTSAGWEMSTDQEAVAVLCGWEGTVGRASCHASRLCGVSIYAITGSKAQWSKVRKGDEHPTYTLVRSIAPFIFSFTVTSKINNSVLTCSFLQ